MFNPRTMVDLYQVPRALFNCVINTFILVTLILVDWSYSLFSLCTLYLSKVSVGE